MVSRIVYDACYKEIMQAKLDAPKIYECMTVYFDTEKLENVRDKYGYDLYISCLRDATEVIERYGF